jgi:REP element-mobilizing transposase RayT
MSRRYHGGDLRKGRFSQPGGIYLITTVTHKREPLFIDLFLGRIVVNTLKRESNRVITLAYVLMPDHMHWLARLEAGIPLGAVMQAVKSVSSHRINRYLGREGCVWQPRYHDHAVRREEDIRALARYVIANPLRAGLVNAVGDYPLWDAMWLQDPLPAGNIRKSPRGCGPYSPRGAGPTL